MKKRVCVLGDGAFGTAFAQLISLNGYEVNLWCYNSQVFSDIKDNKKNSIYLPEIILNNLVEPHTDIQEAIINCDIIFLAIPVQYIRSVLEPVKNIFLNKTVCILSKGIEANTLKLPTDIIQDLVGKNINLLVISGPSFARDLVLDSSTGLVVAAENKQVLNNISELINKNNKIYLQYSNDIYGVQLCGAVKNIVALGIGILEGAGIKDNTKALFFYKMLYELKTIIKFFHGDPETINLLCGIGDLVLTCFMSQGRNKQIGIKIGQGHDVAQLLSESIFVCEGINTIKSLYQLILKHDLDMPLSKSIYGIIFDKLDTQILISNLI